MNVRRLIRNAIEDQGFEVDYVPRDQLGGGRYRGDMCRTRQKVRIALGLDLAAELHVLAHEYGHIVCGHVGGTHDDAEHMMHERDANFVASTLLAGIVAGIKPVLGEGSTVVITMPEGAADA